MRFRVTIDTGPEGLSDIPTAFQVLANFPHFANVAATWPGEAEPVPGRRYIVLVDATDDKDAEARVRDVVGPDTKLRVTPHGRRVTSPIND